MATRIEVNGPQEQQPVVASHLVRLHRVTGIAVVHTGYGTSHLSCVIRVEATAD